MKQWFQQYSARQQAYLLAVAAVVALYLLLVLIWQPLAGARDEMALRKRATSQQLARVQALASELQQFNRDGGGQNRHNMNQLINSSTSEFGIRPTRIQLNAWGETRIRFENVGFTELLRWLHKLESLDGVRVREVAINQSDRGGVVNASVRLGLA